MNRWTATVVAIAGFSVTQIVLGGTHVIALTVGYALGMISWVLIEAFYFQRVRLTGETP